MLRVILLKYSGSGQMQRLLTQGLYLTVALTSGASLAAVSQTPLFLAQPPKPNVMFTLDNSGSMVWNTITGYDALAEYTAPNKSYNGSNYGYLDSTKDTRAYFSSDYNGAWYNPSITYMPAVKYDGTSYGNSVATSAKQDPFVTSTTSINLTTVCYGKAATPDAGNTNTNYAGYNYTWNGGRWVGTSNGLPNYTNTTDDGTNTFGNGSNICQTQSGNISGWTTKIAKWAFYYELTGSISNIKNAAPPDRFFGTRKNIIEANQPFARPASRTDCTSCSYKQEIQNFANWYTYYRTRILMTKSSMGLAFAPIDPIVNPENEPKFRVGFNTINGIAADRNGDPKTATVNNSEVSDGWGWLTIRDFNVKQKEDFYTRLYKINPYQGTPLRAQMDRIGRLYKGTLTDFDYKGNDPYRASKDDVLVSCRPSYHIMSTDGFWNGASGDSPFTSNSSLADIADYYYKTDLRTGLTNNVKPTNTRDTSTKQHMTTFTIGLGADGTIPYSSTEPTTWPTAVGDTPTAIDDLWHAAVTGKGRYFSAKNPVELQSGLVSILKDIAIQPAAAASGAITGSAIGGDSLFYAPSFESGKWIGHLKAYSLSSAADIGTVQWDAATKLPAWNARNIVTWNPAAGTGTGAAVDFTWTNLTTGSGSQQAALTSSDVLDYLKGNGAKEQTSDGNGPGIYRYRANKLGDIVNSSPLYVKKSDFGYRVLPAASGGGTTYSKFVNGVDGVGGKANRTAMLYAGANDGMLHGFDATTGVEKFAFVPNALYPNLVSLSSPDYGHQYYVDGLLTEGDAYIGGAWKNILLGSVGAGGSSIFAIDVTDPAALGAGKVMWEIKGSGNDDFADMGRVMGQITVVRLRNGQWAAIFGNGYDSANDKGKAVLYVINLSTGALIKKFNVAPTVEANGMAAPALLFNAQRELVGAYAGDLKGNLWKFKFQNEDDLADISVGSWSSSILFSAINGDNKVQPMVKRPALERHPQGGYMVTVATGKFMEEGDKTNVDVQSIYGIWDNAKKNVVKVTGRSQLTQQIFTAEIGGRRLSVNNMDWPTKRGWYIDLSLTTGERVIGDLEILDNAVLVATTLAPVSDICLGGGASQQMAINYLTGGVSPKAVFWRGDTKSIGLSSISIGGTAANPAWVTTGRGKRVAVFSALDGSVPGSGAGGPIRLETGIAPIRSWHQLTIKN